MCCLCHLSFVLVLLSVFASVFAHHGLPRELECWGVEARAICGRFCWLICCRLCGRMPYFCVVVDNTVILLLFLTFFSLIQYLISGVKGLADVFDLLGGTFVCAAFCCCWQCVCVKFVTAHFFVGGKLWRQDRLIEVALDLSNTLDKGVMSRFLITLLLPTDFSWFRGICATFGDACFISMLVVVPLLGGRHHSFSCQIGHCGWSGLCFLCRGWFVWGLVVIKEIFDSLSKFITDCVSKAVGDLVAWHMASYALQGAF